MAPVVKKMESKKTPAKKKHILKNNEKESEKQSVISGQLAKKMSKKKKLNGPKQQRGLLFIKHLPHGFFEDQMKGYFEQFGRVTRLRLARSSKTGNSKGFAFVEFEYPEVAEIAAETMNNYLMFHRLIKAAYISPEEQKFNYFKTTVRKVKNKAGKEIYVSGKTTAIQKKVKEHNNWSDEAYQRRTERTMKKLKKLQSKCECLGIDFSKCMIQPNKLSPEEMKLKQKQEDLENEESGKLLLRKRKIGNEDTIQQNNKMPKDIALEDLLGDTIVEEDSSEDEDFVASEGHIDSDDENVENGHKNELLDKRSRKGKDSKNIALEDLLGDTLVEEDSSEDEDFVASEGQVESENEDGKNGPKKKISGNNKSEKRSKKGKNSENIALEDLLGDTLVEEDSSEDEDFVASEGQVESEQKEEKNGPKKKISGNSNSEKRSKKGKNAENIALEDLLGDTLVEEDSSEDEDFVASEGQVESENEKEKNGPKKKISVNNKSEKRSKKDKNSENIALEDLLGDTLVEEDSSEDEDFVARRNEKKDDEKQKDTTRDKPSSNERKSKSSRMEISSDRLGNLIKRKPHLGGIKKQNKKSSKTAPIGEAKKQMQIVAAKELIKNSKQKWRSFAGAVSKNKNKRKA